MRIFLSFVLADHFHKHTSNTQSYYECYTFTRLSTLSHFVEIAYAFIQSRPVLSIKLRQHFKQTLIRKYLYVQCVSEFAKLLISIHNMGWHTSSNLDMYLQVTGWLTNLFIYVVDS